MSTDPQRIPPHQWQKRRRRFDLLGAFSMACIAACLTGWVSEPIAQATIPLAFTAMTLGYTGYAGLSVWDDKGRKE